MFCPKCSQQQVSDDTRFCSRCGFHLNVVKALLSNENLPASGEPRKISRNFSMRDMSIGAVLMFMVAFVITVITSDLPPMHNARIVMLVIAWFVLTLALNIKPLVQYFLRGDVAARETEPVGVREISGLSGHARPSALPSSQSIPVDVYQAPLTTAEMTPSPSVTEDTTNLLKNRPA